MSETTRAVPKPDYTDAEGVMTWCGRGWDVAADPTGPQPRISIWTGSSGLGNITDPVDMADALVAAAFACGYKP